MNNFLEWLEQKHPEYLNEQSRGLLPSDGLQNSMKPDPKAITEREDLLKNYLPITDEDIDALPIEKIKKDQMKNYYHMKNLVADSWTDGYFSDRTLLATFFPGSDARAHYFEAEKNFRELIKTKGWKIGRAAGYLYNSEIWFRPKTGSEKYQDVRLSLEKLESKVEGLIDLNKRVAANDAQKKSNYDRKRTAPKGPIDDFVKEKEDFIRNYVPLDAEYIFEKYKDISPEDAKNAVSYFLKNNIRNKLTQTIQGWFTAPTITAKEQAAFKEIKDREYSYARYNTDDLNIEWKQFGARWYRTKNRQEQLADARKEISELKTKMKSLEQYADKASTGLSVIKQWEIEFQKDTDKLKAIEDNEKEMIKNKTHMIGPDGKLLRDLKGNPIPIKQDKKSKDRHSTPKQDDDLPDIWKKPPPPVRTPDPNRTFRDPFETTPRPTPKRPAGSTGTNKDINPFQTR